MFAQVKVMDVMDDPLLALPAPSGTTAKVYLFLG
jgi:hypothetical protein